MSTIQAELHGAKPQVFLCRKAIRRVLPASLREHPRRIDAEEIECLPLRGRWGRGLLEAFGFADQDVVQNNGAEIGKQGKETVQVRRAIPRFRHDSDARHARFRGSGATGGPDSPDSARRTSDRTAPRYPARKSPRAALFNGLIFVSCYALNWEKRLGSKTMDQAEFQDWMSASDRPTSAQRTEAARALSTDADEERSVAAVERSVGESRICPRCARSLGPSHIALNHSAGPHIRGLCRIRTAGKAASRDSCSASEASRPNISETTSKMPARPSRPERKPIDLPRSRRQFDMRTIREMGWTYRHEMTNCTLFEAGGCIRGACGLREGNMSPIGRASNPASRMLAPAENAGVSTCRRS